MGGSSSELLRKLILNAIIPALDAFDVEEPIRKYEGVKDDERALEELEKELLKKYILEPLNALYDRIEEIERNYKDRELKKVASELATDLVGLLRILESALDEKEFEEEGYSLICYSRDCIETVKMALLSLYINILTIDKDELSELSPGDMLVKALDVLEDFWRLSGAISVELDLDELDQILDEGIEL